MNDSKPDLLLHGRKVASVFNLLGEKENDITYSLGWALGQSTSFLSAFLNRLGLVLPSSSDQITISLQDYKKSAGITDIEIVGPAFHVIVEAKRGWSLPDKSQLRQYSRRLIDAKCERQLLVTMSESTQEFFKSVYQDALDGIPIKHMSWREVAHLSNITSGGHAEKRLMAELKSYISTFVAMQDQQSNLVFVVSLSANEVFPGVSFIDVVKKRLRYFHAFGLGEKWPRTPPNYIAFRYYGKLQSIHHIDDAEVITNFHPIFPESKDTPIKKHYLYSLGPAIMPPKEVKSNNMYGSMRVWAMLDLLLTCDTVLEARDKTNDRIAATVRM